MAIFILSFTCKTVIIVLVLLCVSISETSFFVSKYEPLIIDRKFGHLHQLQSKPMMMPNPRGFFAVNNDQIYVDFCAQGRYFQFTLNRGSPAVPRDLPLHYGGSTNSTKKRFRQLDFFSGYLKNDQRFEVFGYVNPTKSKSETLVLSINLGSDNLHIENAEYVVGNDNWFNTVAYLRSDVAIKGLLNSFPFRSRRLLGESKPEVVDYYTNVAQYNYSVWEKRSMNPDAKICGMVVASDYRVYNHFGKAADKVILFMSYAVSMAYFAYRVHDFDMDGISDNFSFKMSLAHYFSSPDEKDPPFNVLEPLFKKDDNTYLEWVDALATARQNMREGDRACNILLFTSETMRNKNGASASGLCCEKTSSTIINLKPLPTPSSAGLTLSHHLAGLIGGKSDSGRCLEAENKNIILGKYLSDESLVNYENLNNLRLSPCSMLRIQKKIKEVYGRTSCLVGDSISNATCGNKKLDVNGTEQEECDCGVLFECMDKCCTPAGLFNVPGCVVDKVTQHQRLVGNKVVNYTYECSPVSHECCNEDCLFIKSEEKKICGSVLECLNPTYCDGVSPFCPNSTNTPKEDGSRCEDNSKLCINGTCAVDVCTLKKIEMCICTDVENSCFVCCLLNNGSAQICQPVPLNGTNFFRKNDISCGENLICENGLCKEDSDTSKLENVADEFSDWYSAYWFLFLIAAVILMILIILATAFYKKRHKNKKVETFQGRVNAAQQRLESYASLHSDYTPETIIRASRLLALFPTVSQHIVLENAASEDSEEAIVLKMLGKGYPMRRITS